MKTAINKELNKYFNRVKVTTLARLKDKLNTNVDKTIQRYLKEFGYLTSYTHKGKYYTLQHIPVFDKHGLWECKEVYFSNHGKLINTMEYFVAISEMSYCSEELQNRLHVNVNDALLNLVNNKRLHREKIEKRFYYFSGTVSIRKRQLLLRRSIEETKFGEKLFLINSTNLELKRGFALFFNNLDEKQKRIYTGLESACLEYGGDKIVSQTYGVDPHTVSKGRQEILSGDFEKERIRKIGGGRKLIKKKSGNN